MPFYCKYRAGVSKEGMLTGIEITYYVDCGYTDSCCTADGAMGVADNVYKCPTWTVEAFGVKTNTPANSYCR